MAIARGCCATMPRSIRSRCNSVDRTRRRWRGGLTQKDKREIPPLDYGRVFRLKRAYPRLPIVLNGGIGDLEQGLDFLSQVDGMMMGRAAYREPWRLLTVDARVFGAPAQ